MLAVLAVLPLGIGLHHTKQHTVAAAEEACGQPGQDACVTIDGDETIHSCASAPGPVTVGAVNVDHEANVYKCLACARPNNRACECTHENLDHPPPGDHNPCWKGIVHWCFYEPQFVVTEDDDGFLYCRHNDTNTELEKDCGLEGHEACLDEDGSYSCLSPVLHNGANFTITAIQDSTDPSSTFMCEACGKPGLPACQCASLPQGTCGNATGTTSYCDNGGNIYMANDRPYCS